MKVCLISKSDIKGGAAKVAFALGRGLREEGHDCTMLVQEKASSESWIQEMPHQPSRKKNVSQKIIHRIGLNSLFLNSSFPRVMGEEFFSQFDIIHLHDLPTHFNYWQLAWLSSFKPVFWTLHTMNAFTGGCLYSYECRRHLSSCGNCPQYGQFPLQWLHRDGSRQVLALKKLIYGRSRLFPICVSEWLAKETRQGILGDFPVTTIQNPVDQEAFFPIEKSIAKEKLGIPPESRTILFSVASNIEDTRKGLDIICEALTKLDIENAFLIPTAITHEGDSLKNALAGLDSLPARHLSSDEELRLHYSAADVIWHPTRADTSSMVSLEALSCGTPVIAARVGGVPEIVEDGVNGILIEPGSADALVTATHRFFLEDGLASKLSHEARKSASGSHTVSYFVDQHLQVFNDVLDERNKTN